ncbi:hypothetical protein GGR55DRAFT_630363 [Xylaria sp. FL0064]|nr:hypothetical protein GGR55DRAFT_630363 [Xylaria sp. FL0064]
MAFFPLALPLVSLRSLTVCDAVASHHTKPRPGLESRFSSLESQASRPYQSMSMLTVLTSSSSSSVIGLSQYLVRYI